MPSSFVICGDPELSQLADDRQQAFSEAMSRLDPQQRNELLADQQDRVKTYSAACGVRSNNPPPNPVPATIKACFKRASEAPLAYIRAYSAPGNTAQATGRSPEAARAQGASGTPPVLTQAPSASRENNAGTVTVQVIGAGPTIDRTGPARRWSTTTAGRRLHRIMRIALILASITTGERSSAKRLVQVMGAPSWASSPKFDTVAGRLQHQDELDEHIEAWSMKLGKYELTERCQAAGVRALPVQSAADRVEHDPQLHHREMYLAMEHPALGVHKVQNAPFKLSETPASNHLPSPLIG